MDDPLCEATQSFKWIYQIYEKEQRLDRLVNRLLAIQKATQAELEQMRSGKGWRLISAARSVRDRLTHVVDYLLHGKKL
jgi:hypothetical protein